MSTVARLERLFKERYGIIVRIARTRDANQWIAVWAPRTRDSSYTSPKYTRLFPAELGNLCMRALYADRPDLCELSWGENVETYRIAMHESQWERLIQKLEDEV